MWYRSVSLSSDSWSHVCLYMSTSYQHNCFDDKVSDDTARSSINRERKRHTNRKTIKRWKRDIDRVNIVFFLLVFFSLFSHTAIHIYIQRRPPSFSNWSLETNRKNGSYKDLGAIYIYMYTHDSRQWMHLLIIGCAYVYINTYEFKEKENIDLSHEKELCRRWLTDRPTNIDSVEVQAKAVKIGKLLRRRAGF
jgi:hypothetical protein